MPSFAPRRPPLAAVTSLTAVLSFSLVLACAGCGGQQDSGPAAPASASEALILPSDVYADACAADNPLAPEALRTGSSLVERLWLRSMLNERYLWREQLPLLDATDARYQGVDHETSMSRWFQDLVHPPGSKDKFSYLETTAENDAANQGERIGPGLQTTRVVGVPARMTVLMVSPGSPAAAAGVQRGDEVIRYDGLDLATASEADLADLPRRARTVKVGEVTSWVIRRGSAVRELSLTNVLEQAPPVALATVLPASQTGNPTGGPVGYLLFNEFTLPAEDALAAAFQQFQAQRVRDLIIDLRYNGGGLGFIAAQLAYMIAGPSTGDRVFNADRLNDRLTEQMGPGASTLPFLSTSCHPGPFMNGCTLEQPLPSLSLSRVFVLTGPGTCSASELLINGLRGVDVEVIQIGETTCGKPFGFQAVAHCGYTTHAIDRQTSNAKGFGDYADGFSPGGTGAAGLPGCRVADDLTHALGHPSEGLLSTALYFRSQQQCPSGRFWAAPLRADGLQGAAAVSPSGAASSPTVPLQPSRPLLLKRPSL